MKKKLYLAGTIQGKHTDKVVKKFTSKQKALEKIGFKVFSPIRGRGGDEVVTKDGVNSKYSPNEIMHRDLNDIDNCDIVVAFMDYPSIGTSMEILYARYIRHVPVVVVSRSPRVFYHPWIMSLATKRLRTLAQVTEYLQRMWL